MIPRIILALRAPHPARDAALKVTPVTCKATLSALKVTPLARKATLLPRKGTHSGPAGAVSPLDRVNRVNPFALDAVGWNPIRPRLFPIRPGCR